METFTGIKPFVENPNYNEQRQKSLNRLNFSEIDAPMIEIIKGFSKLSYCFTLQSCYGHFLHDGQKDLHNIEPLPISKMITDVEYRIAYIALCIQHSNSGRKLFDDLSRFPSIDPEYIQFGCADWFWQKQVNSYVLQVEPERFKRLDQAIVSHQEGLYIEQVRNQFFKELLNLLISNQ